MAGHLSMLVLFALLWLEHGYWRGTLIGVGVGMVVATPVGLLAALRTGSRRVPRRPSSCQKRIRWIALTGLVLFTTAYLGPRFRTDLSTVEAYLVGLGIGVLIWWVLICIGRVMSLFLGFDDESAAAEEPEESKRSRWISRLWLTWTIVEALGLSALAAWLMVRWQLSLWVAAAIAAGLVYLIEVLRQWGVLAWTNRRGPAPSPPWEAAGV